MPEPARATFPATCGLPQALIPLRFLAWASLPLQPPFTGGQVWAFVWEDT